MKKFLFVFFLIGTVAYSQKMDCKKFKNGKFYARAFPDEYAVRKDSIQENYRNGKLESVWKVNWLSDCKFEILCVKDEGPYQAQPGFKYVYTIFATEEDCYYVSIWYANEEYPDGTTFQRGLCLMKD